MRAIPQSERAQLLAQLGAVRGLLMAASNRLDTAHPKRRRDSAQRRILSAIRAIDGAIDDVERLTGWEVRP